MQSSIIRVSRLGAMKILEVLFWNTKSFILFYILHSLPSFQPLPSSMAWGWDGMREAWACLILCLWMSSSKVNQKNCGLSQDILLFLPVSISSSLSPSRFLCALPGPNLLYSTLSSPPRMWLFKNICILIVKLLKTK